MKNILSENMLRFGTKNLSEATKQRLLAEQVDAAAYGVPGNTATNDEDFVKWYANYLSPSTGYVGQTLLIMKAGDASQAKDNLNNLFASDGGIVANIIGRCVVGSSMNFGYRALSPGATQGQTAQNFDGIRIWDTAITRNYDWAKQTMIVKTAEQYDARFPGLYDTNLAEAGLSLVQDAFYMIPGTSTGDAEIPIVVGSATYSTSTTDGSKTITADPVIQKKTSNWMIQSNGSFSNSSNTIKGFCPWVDQKLVPVNYNGYGITAAAGTEVPIQTEASMTAWVAKNIKKGKYIGPAGN